jgi:hypothetical protein
MHQVDEVRQQTGLDRALAQVAGPLVRDVPLDDQTGLNKHDTKNNRDKGFQRREAKRRAKNRLHQRPINGLRADENDDSERPSGEKTTPVPDELPIIKEDRREQFIKDRIADFLVEPLRPTRIFIACQVNDSRHLWAGSYSHLIRPMFIFCMCVSMCVLSYLVDYRLLFMWQIPGIVLWLYDLHFQWEVFLCIGGSVVLLPFIVEVPGLIPLNLITFIPYYMIYKRPIRYLVPDGFKQLTADTIPEGKESMFQYLKYTHYKDVFVAKEILYYFEDNMSNMSDTTRILQTLKQVVNQLFCEKYAHIVRQETDLYFKNCLSEQQFLFNNFPAVKGVSQA